jgi:hypothetical protein
LNAIQLICSRFRDSKVDSHIGAGHRTWSGSNRASLMLLVAGLFLAVPVGSQSTEAASEQSIKAAYLYKFADYVEWPESVLQGPATPFTIGVVGAASLADELEEMIRGRTAHGRPIAVRRIAVHDRLHDVHVLFIGSAAADSMVGLATAASEQSALVVTEAGDALSLGSVINFREVNQRIRFEVSLDAADRSRLKLSARLLAVAARVQPRTR